MSLLLLGSLDEREYARWRRHLTAHLPPGENLVVAGDAYGVADHVVEEIDIALVANPAPGSLANYPNLRFIQSLWAGVDRLLADPLLPRGVPLARLVDPDLTQAMVECVVTHVTALHRQAPAYARQQARREWRQLSQPLAAQRAVGVLGLGELGAAAARAVAALGFTMSGWSRTPRTIEGVRCICGDAGFASLIENAEILVNLLPLTPDTTGILDRRLFARMPRGASLVNVARGAHLVEADLLDALETGALDHAILDVFRDEPLPPEHPFWPHPRITVMPHVAAYSAPESAAKIAAANVRAFREGRLPTGLVERARGY